VIGEKYINIIPAGSESVRGWSVETEKRLAFSAISDFASSSETPEATSDKAAMSAFPGE
jgi:hypothetical protein